MANFLQISEPEAYSLDSQANTVSNNERLKNQSTNALVAQYGPEAADPQQMQAAVDASTSQQVSPYKVQEAQAVAQNDQITAQNAALAQRQQGVLNAVRSLKTVAAQGGDVGAAFDSTVTPNAQLLGIKDPAELASIRKMITDNPGALDQIENGLMGNAKPEGMPVMYQKADGTQGAAYITDRGTTVQMNLPQGATIKGKVSGAPIQVDLGGGKYGIVSRDQYGNLTATDLNGTPLQGEQAQAALQRAAAAQQNADTNSFSAGTRANNTEFGAAPGTAPGAPSGPGRAGPLSVNQAIIGQESGGNPNSPTSVDGAHGIGQVTQATFDKWKKPGEKIDNPADNFAVANRIIDAYQQQWPNDPARVAVAYFSGPGNVAPAGSPTPYVHDYKDGNGVRTSAYAQQVLGRMGSDTAQAATAPNPNATAPAAGSGPLFDRLPPKGKQAAIAQATGIVNGTDQLQLADQQIDRVLEAAKNPLATGLGQLAGSIPGLPAYDMVAQTKQLQSLGLTDWIQSLKNAGGSTGIGRVLQSEANAAMSAYGNLDPGQDSTQFVQHVQMFQHRIHQLQNTATAAFKQQWGVDAYTAAGVQQGGSGQQAATGSAPASTAALRAKYGL